MDKNKNNKDSLYTIVGYSIFTILALFGILFIILFSTGQINQSHQIFIYTDNMSLLTDIDNLALNLSNNGWVVYYSDNCGYCGLEMEEFGNSWKYLNSVNVSEHGLPEGMAGVPTWFNYNTGEIRPGYQTIDNLNLMVGI